MISLGGLRFPWLTSRKEAAQDNKDAEERARRSLKDRRMKSGNTKFSRNKQAKLAARMGRR